MTISSLIHQWRTEHFACFYFGKNDLEHYLNSFRRWSVGNGIEPFEDDDIKPAMQAEVSQFTIATLPVINALRVEFGGFPVASEESLALFEQLTGKKFTHVEA